MGRSYLLLHMPMIAILATLDDKEGGAEVTEWRKQWLARTLPL